MKKKGARSALKARLKIRTAPTNVPTNVPIDVGLAIMVLTRWAVHEQVTVTIDGEHADHPRTEARRYGKRI